MMPNIFGSPSKKCIHTARCLIFFKGFEISFSTMRTYARPHKSFFALAPVFILLVQWSLFVNILLLIPMLIICCLSSWLTESNYLKLMTMNALEIFSHLVTSYANNYIALKMNTCNNSKQ